MNPPRSPRSTASDSHRLRVFSWLFGILFVILLVVVALPSLTSFRGLVFQLAAIGLAVVGMVFGFLVLRRLNLRLDRLAGVARDIGAGDLNTRSDDQGNDAVSHLAGSINRMAEQIQVSIREGDRQRAELADREAQLEEQNNALLAEHQRRARFGEFLTDINTVDLDRITQRGLQFVATLANAQLAVFYLMDGDTGRLQKVAETGLDGHALLELVSAAPESGLPLEVLRTRDWMQLSNVDVEMVPALELGFGTARIREIIGIPVLFQREALGVLVLAALRDLDDYGREAVANAVEALGVAVNNALTYKTVQRQALHLETVNRELRKADRLRSEFVANISHELRTPLNSIIGFSHLLSQNRAGTLSEADLGFVEKVNRNGRHLLGLINDILDLSKIEAGRMELVLDDTDLGALVSEVVDMLQPQLQVGRLSLNVELPARLPMLRLDGDKLKQVLINLLGNAVKFTQQGEVGLAVERSADGRLLIHVRDTGIGIPPDRLEAIFEPFRQAESGTTREFGGTGLGLSISRALVELMEGRLRVSSEPGKGSCFTLDLPFAPAPGSGAPDPDAAATAPVAGLPPGTSCQVLVLDRRARSLAELAERVEALGARAQAAADLRQALSLARVRRPCLILLQCELPDDRAWQTLAELRQDVVTRELPVVMASRVAERRRAVALGAVDMLAEPIPEADLRHLLAEYAGPAVA